MELDQNLVNKINSLDEDALRESIRAVAQQMGVEEKKTAAFLGDMGKVKKAVSSLTQKDLDQITRMMGKEKSEELLSTLRREVDGK